MIKNVYVTRTEFVNDKGVLIAVKISIYIIVLKLFPDSPGTR